MGENSRKAPFISDMKRYFFSISSRARLPRFSGMRAASDTASSLSSSTAANHSANPSKFVPAENAFL